MPAFACSAAVRRPIRSRLWEYIICSTASATIADISAGLLPVSLFCADCCSVGLCMCTVQVNEAAEIIYELVDPEANLIFGAVVDPDVPQVGYLLRTLSNCEALLMSGSCLPTVEL